MIRELTTLEDDWFIKVRIIRLWKLMAFKNPLETWKIKMICKTRKQDYCHYLIGDLISGGAIAQAMVHGNRRPFIRLELEDLTLVATVKKIERESDWWYLTCVKCNHNANQDTVIEKDKYGMIVKKRIVFMCTNKACGQDTDVEYKYKIPLRVMDSTGSVSLTLFDRQAHFIIDKSVAELLQELKKDVLSVTGDNIASRDDEKSTTTSPGKSKFLSVINNFWYQAYVDEDQQELTGLLDNEIPVSTTSKKHDIIATPQGVGSSLSANIPDTSLVPRRRGRPMKEISNDLLPRRRGKPPLTNIPNDLLPRPRGRPPLSAVSIGVRGLIALGFIVKTIIIMEVFYQMKVKVQNSRSCAYMTRKMRCKTGFLHYERLWFHRRNQKILRVESYQKLSTSADNGNTYASKLGKRIVLPSSFTGGITRFLNGTGLRLEDRPDVVCKVFKMKLDHLIKNLKEKKIFGRINAGKCTKQFPKKFFKRTMTDSDGFPVYKRPDNGRFIEKGKMKLHNGYVVCYHKRLLKTYQAHINVEWCNQAGSIKYLFKYINKGLDRITAKVCTDKNANQETTDEEVVDEIKDYYDCRYLSACESTWRIMRYEVHYNYPPAERLPFHLLGEQ
nr:uncharacterized protein [Tanacetum cinerariifolium]